MQRTAHREAVSLNIATGITKCFVCKYYRHYKGQEAGKIRDVNQRPCFDRNSPGQEKPQSLSEDWGHSSTSITAKIACQICTESTESLLGA
jgi:hypothetical protein